MIRFSAIMQNYLADLRDEFDLTTAECQYLYDLTTTEYYQLEDRVEIKILNGYIDYLIDDWLRRRERNGG